MVLPPFEEAVGVQNSPDMCGSCTSRVWASSCATLNRFLDFENKKWLFCSLSLCRRLAVQADWSSSPLSGPASRPPISFTEAAVQPHKTAFQRFARKGRESLKNPLACKKIMLSFNKSWLWERVFFLYILNLRSFCKRLIVMREKNHPAKTSVSSCSSFRAKRHQRRRASGETDAFAG